MQMHQVRYFLAVCRDLSFTRAARRCGVKQPSLTNALQRLEQELGGRLIERCRPAVRLTALGARLRPYFATIDQHARLVTREARRHRDGARGRRKQTPPARKSDESEGLALR